VEEKEEVVVVACSALDVVGHIGKLIVPTQVARNISWVVMAYDEL